LATPTTAPPAANAPSIPMMRPRTRRLLPTNRQPSMICLNTDGVEIVPSRLGMSRSVKMRKAETR
jgi:hypothetical protein